MAGAAGHGGMAATTDSTGTAIRQGRPGGGQGEKRDEYLCKRREVRGTSQCTRTRVGVAGLVSW